MVENFSCLGDVSLRYRMADEDLFELMFGSSNEKGRVIALWQSSSNMHVCRKGPPAPFPAMPSERLLGGKQYERLEDPREPSLVTGKENNCKVFTCYLRFQALWIRTVHKEFPGHNLTERESSGSSRPNLQTATTFLLLCPFSLEDSP